MPGFWKAIKQRRMKINQLAFCLSSYSSISFQGLFIFLYLQNYRSGFLSSCSLKTFSHRSSAYMRVVLYVTPVFLRFMVMIGYLMLVKVRHCFKLFTAVLETTRSLLLNLSYSLFLRHFKINYKFNRRKTWNQIFLQGATWALKWMERGEQPFITLV